MTCWWLNWQPVNGGLLQGPQQTIQHNHPKCSYVCFPRTGGYLFLYVFMGKVQHYKQYSDCDPQSFLNQPINRDIQMA